MCNLTFLYSCNFWKISEPTTNYQYKTFLFLSRLYLPSSLTFELKIVFTKKSVLRFTSYSGNFYFLFFAFRVLSTFRGCFIRQPNGFLFWLSNKGRFVSPKETIRIRMHHLNFRQMKSCFKNYQARVFVENIVQIVLFLATPNCEVTSHVVLYPDWKFLYCTSLTFASHKLYTKQQTYHLFTLTPSNENIRDNAGHICFVT